MRADKQKVVNEVWEDERIRSFLRKAPLAAGLDADYSALLHAYRSMRPEDFRTFIGYFQAAGRNLKAENDDGETLLEVIANHRRAGPFRKILCDAGAGR